MRGHLTYAGNSISYSLYSDFSPRGLVTSNKQVTGTNSFPAFAYTYSLTGKLKSVTLPSGRQNVYGYDLTDRVNSVKSAGADIATGITYTPHGALATMTRASDGLNEAWTYNNRLQPTGVSVGPSGSVLGLNLYYCSSKAASCTSNNGNLLTQTIQAIGKDQSFSYDGFNRIATSAEGTSWTENFGYDQFANRWVNAWTGISLDSFTPIGSSNFDLPTNRLVIQTMTATGSYDFRGNQIVKGGFTQTYDGENRQTGSTLNSATTTYGYDAEGRRVKKQTPTLTTYYVYDAQGALAAEYESGVSSPPLGCQVCTMSVDHLGNTRVITDGSGHVMERHDYLPFGEDLWAGIGGSTTTLGYLNSTDPEGLGQKFTGKQRDSETGLDYFGARYYSGAQGRFTSPDPTFMTKARISDPQQWNLYAYTRSNPLKYVDPDGHELRLAIYSGSLPQGVATASANYMVTTLRNAGVKNVTYDLKSGSPNAQQTFGAQMLPSPHSVLVELRPSKAGDPIIPVNEGGHNWGGQAAVDTSLVTSKTGDPTKQAIGIGNLAVHEVGHEVTPFHPTDDPVMDRSATDENAFNPGLNFGSAMSLGLQNRYNTAGEVEQTPPLPPSPPPPGKKKDNQ